MPKEKNENKFLPISIREGNSRCTPRRRRTRRTATHASHPRRCRQAAFGCRWRSVPPCPGSPRTRGLSRPNSYPLPDFGDAGAFPSRDGRLLGTTSCPSIRD